MFLELRMRQLPVNFTSVKQKTDHFLEVSGSEQFIALFDIWTDAKIRIIKTQTTLNYK